MHYHVMTAQDGIPHGLLQFESGLVSIHTFLDLVHGILGFEDDPAKTEHALIANLAKLDVKGVYAGQDDNFMVVWMKCDEAIHPNYN